MEPGNHQELCAGCESKQSWGERGLEVEPHIRRAFRTLTRRFASCAQRRANESNRSQRVRIGCRHETNLKPKAQSPSPRRPLPDGSLDVFARDTSFAEVLLERHRMTLGHLL